MNPIAFRESARKLVETNVNPMYQAVATAAVMIEPTCGVWKRGWTFPNALGRAPRRAIESDVREPGRIVVWHEASALVSTARMTSRSRGLPSTWVDTTLNADESVKPLSSCTPA